MTYTDVVNMVKVASAAQQKQAGWMDDIKHTWRGIRQNPRKFFKDMVSNEDPMVARTRNAVINNSPLRPINAIANGAVRASVAAGRAMQPAVNDIKHTWRGLRQDPRQAGRDLANTTLGQVGKNLYNMGVAAVRPFNPIPAARAAVNAIRRKTQPAAPSGAREAYTPLLDYEAAERMRSEAASQGLERLMNVSTLGQPGSAIGAAAAAAASEAPVPRLWVERAPWEWANRMLSD